MPPQPLSRVKKFISRHGGPGIIMYRPQLAAYVAGTITAWSHTETALGRFFATCLRSDSSAGLSMYLSLSGAQAKRSVLEAAARKTLSDSEMQMFQSVMKAIKPVRDRRNEFAHGLWSTSEDLPDALLWDSPEDELHLYEQNLKDLEIVELKTMVYRTKDLKEAFEEARQATACTHQMGLLINPKLTEMHDELRRQLYSSPLLKRCGAIPPH